jgi:hypothetical protein
VKLTVVLQHQFAARDRDAQVVERVPDLGGVVPAEATVARRALPARKPVSVVRIVRRVV